jgi:hypothetical protein
MVRLRHDRVLTVLTCSCDGAYLSLHLLLRPWRGKSVRLAVRPGLAELDNLGLFSGMEMMAIPGHHSPLLSQKSS